MQAGRLSADTAELLRLLNAHAVRYLLVGGQAVILHGYPRLTGDVDLWFEQTTENVVALYDALLEFWQGEVPGIESSVELLEPDIILMFGRPPNRIDLLAEVSGVRFADAWSRRLTETLPSESGPVQVSVIGLDDLLVNKRASARHKDLDDVEHLDAMRRTAPDPFFEAGRRETLLRLVTGRVTDAELDELRALDDLDDLEARVLAMLTRR